MFKNAFPVRLTAPFTLSAEELAERLEADAFKPCGSLQPVSIGWTAPARSQLDDAPLTHAAAGAILICLRREERVLPAAVVREKVEERVAKIAQEEGRPVRRKERTAIKDEVIHELLPKSFTRSSYVYAYIAPRSNWIVVDAGSAKRVEELLSLLRQSLGSLSVTPLQVESSPTATMTTWLTEGQSPEGVELGDECVFKGTAEGGGTARTKRIDARASELLSHIEAGRRLVQISMTFDNRVSFVLHEDLSLHRLGYEDAAQEEVANMDQEDAAAVFDAIFALMVLELDRLLAKLPGWFGGERQLDDAA